MEYRARQTRSIYGSRGRPTTRDGNHHAGHKFGRAEHSRQSSLELCRDIAQYRGAAHPLCFIDEVMDHQIPEGFKLVNIESYDGTTDPAAWIEDYLLHIHMARGDDFHAIKYLPLKLKGPLVIGLIACQQDQSVVGRTWMPHSSTISRALMCDPQTPMT